MAENDLSNEELERQKQRRRAAMATPVADEGDVAFGGMAGIGVLAAVLAAMFAFFGFGTPGTTIDAGNGDSAVVEEEVSNELDLLAMLDVLNANGHEGIVLANDGGVVTVSGTVADATQRAEVLALVAGQPGVTEVIDRLTIAAATETDPEPEAAAATIDASDDGIVLSGTVPSDAAADQLRELAAASYSAGQITDELVVVDGANPATVTLTGTVKDTEIGGELQDGFGALTGFSESSGELTIEADASEEINAILELEPILFQSGTAIILPESQSTIDEAVRILNLFPEANVEIGGHTDSLGPDEANRVLSKSRAEAVLQALRDGGVTNQLSAVGYGESQLKFPDDKGDTQDKIDARQANRRIEFTTLN